MNALETSRWREKRGQDEVEALDTLDKTLAMKNPYGVVNPTADWSTQMNRDFPDASITKLDTSKVVAQQLAKRSASRDIVRKSKKPPPHARDRVGNILSVPMRVTMTTSSADAFAFDEAMQADCLQNASSKEWFQKRHQFSDYVEALAKNPQFKKGAIKKE